MSTEKHTELQQLTKAAEILIEKLDSAKEQLIKSESSRKELLEACREALSCVREWEDADLVLHTKNLQNRLATAIQNAEQLRHE